MATQLGLVSQGVGIDLETLVFGLPTTPTTLILDNAEHVADETGALVAVLTQQLPQLSVVVTSRVPLGISGERVIAVQPMPVGSSEVLTLVADRLGTAVDPSFARILARRSGGLPLAVELLAASSGSWSQPLLSAGLTPATPAATALAEVITDAVTSVSAEAAGVLTWLRHLPGGAGLSLINALLRPDGPCARSQRVASELAAASLVTTTPALGQDGSIRTRYRVLAPVIELAERWSPPEDSRPRAYAGLLAWAKNRVPERGETPVPARIAEVAGELTNLDTALDYWSTHDPRTAVSAAVALDPVWSWAGRSASVRPLVDAALDRLPVGHLDPELRAQLVLSETTGRGLAVIAGSGARYAAALADLSPDSPAGLRATLWGLRSVALGWHADLAGCGEALACARECLASVDQPWMQAQLDQIDALLWAPRGEPARGITALEGIAARFAALGDTQAEAVSYYFSVTLARLAGDARLTSLLERGVAASRACGSPSTLALLAGEEARWALVDAASRRKMDQGVLIARVERAVTDIERAGNLRTAAVARRDLGLFLLDTPEVARAEHELRIATQRLLHLDVGASALAVGGLSTLLAGPVASDLARWAWLLAAGGGTPLLGPERDRLGALTGMEPLPVNGSLPEVIEAVTSALELRLLERTA